MKPAKPQQEEFAALNAQGLSARQLAEMFQVSMRTITRWRSSGVPVRTRPAKHGTQRMLAQGCDCTVCAFGFVRRQEAKRARDREAVAAKRAAMTPEDRAAGRKEQDRLYRERHYESRRAYDKARSKTEKIRLWRERRAAS